MGYFSNHTEFLAYQDSYCFRCQNYKKIKELKYDEEGCPILELHILEKALSKPTKSYKEFFCSIFIPRKKNGKNDKCLFFLVEEKK